MNRKDMILVAVLINAGLLAVLFAAAVIYDTEKVLDQTEMNLSFSETKIAPHLEPPSNLIADSKLVGDEVDHVLNYYSVNSHSPVLVETPVEVYTPPVAVKEEKKLSFNPDCVEVIVKKGDVLEKIARANGTTVNSIKQANHLKGEQLQVGQVLKIPVKKSDNNSETKKNEAVYYTIKNGDNPWKIAKQYNVKIEDILRLNNLNEEKARNLKIGDRIRVK